MCRGGEGWFGLDLQLSQNLLSLSPGSIEVPNHVEGAFREIITFAVHDGLERSDGVLEVNQNTLMKN